MKKAVVLIYPEGRLEGNYPHQKGHPYTQTLPISLLPIAYFLEKIGYNARILDARIEDYKGINLDDVICVGISTMTGIQISNALEIARYIREKNPELPIVWGGIHPTLLPEQTIKSNLVDIVVRGEGEETFIDLVRALETNSSMNNIGGITYKRNGSVFSNPDRDFFDVNRIGLLPYHLLQMDKYSLLSEGFPLNTSRGCPHTCSFCYNLAFNKKSWRYQRADLVLDQIEFIVNTYNQRLFHFQFEDNFFVNRVRAEEICQGLLHRNLKIEWISFCKADYFSKYEPSFIELLRKSGCKVLFFGGESGSKEILRRLRKGITPEQLVETSSRCREFDIKPVFSFIVGFPFEKDGDIKYTFKIIDKILNVNKNAEVNGIFIQTPYPGTPLFAECIMNGLKPPETLEQWGRYQFGDTCNLSWLNGARKDFLNILFRISRFPFYSDSPNFPSTLQTAKKDGTSLIERVSIHFKKIAYLLLWISSKLRWKRKFFKFAIEWRLWDWYARKKRVW